MKTTALVRLLPAVIFLAAFGSAAQPALSTATNVPEVLPASSAYGEAVLMRNIPYVSHATSNQNFNLYLPKEKGTQPFPLVVWIHGGAWLSGSKEWDNVKYLVREGYAIASVDYRYTPEAPFPAQIQDCNAALNFILAHAADYSVDGKRFVIGGGSAGGHLALMLGLARGQKDFGANPAVKPLAILDFFGPTDFNMAKSDLEAIHSQKGLDVFHDAVSKLLGAPVDESAAKAKIASPINYVSSAAPPVLIVQGGKDDLVPVAQSERLHAALDKAGVKNELVVIDGAGHDGPAFSTPEVQSNVIHFLNGVLK
jgi:acetyl esterase/lipase